MARRYVNRVSAKLCRLASHGRLRRIVVARHANTDRPPRDLDRVLTNLGTVQCDAAARTWAAPLGLGVSHVLCSRAVRTEQTAQRVLQSPQRDRTPVLDGVPANGIIGNGIIGNGSSGNGSSGNGSSDAVHCRELRAVDCEIVDCVYPDENDMTSANRKSWDAISKVFAQLGHAPLQVLRAVTASVSWGVGWGGVGSGAGRVSLLLLQFMC